MAVLENSKPKTKKTSASVTSTVPRLCPTTKLNLKHTSYNTPRVKSQFPRSKAVSNEHNTDPRVINLLGTNFQKSITQTENSDQRLKNILSPRNYHGQIPVLSRHSVTPRMSPPVTRSPSPLKKGTQKEKSTNKIKTITLDRDTKRKTKAHSSRSPSPPKQASSNNKKQTSSTSPAARQRKTSEKMGGIKRTESSKQASPRTNSPSKRKSKILASPNENSLNCKSGKEWQTLDRNSSSIILKQTSQPSLHTNEKIIQPHEKISLDHIKNEVFTGDHRRLSLEKVHLCIEQTMENFNVAERKRSYLVRYSSEDTQNQEEISFSFLQNMSRENMKSFPKEKRAIASDVEESKATIRTLSGHELILTPSMKLDVEREEAGTLEISEILQGHGGTFEDNTEVHILQDDENEYDSEVSTDGEMARRGMERSLERRNCNDLPSGNLLWKSPEAGLLNDVDYRQSVYHPAVSRRQKTNSGEMEFRPKSKSIEDNFGFPNKTSKRIVRSRSSNLNNKYASECFTTDKMDICNNERSWAPGFDKTDERPIYNSVIQDVPYLGMKRTRTKKERVSGAILRLTLKIIRLLAIFNLWPGDNCHMLTSQSLRFAR